MDKKFGLFLVVGMAMGAIYGVFFGPAIGNGLLAVALGAIGGVFIGWFVAMIVREREKGNKE